MSTKPPSDVTHDNLSVEPTLEKIKLTQVLSNRQTLACYAAQASYTRPDFCAVPISTAAAAVFSLKHSVSLGAPHSRTSSQGNTISLNNL